MDVARNLTGKQQEHAAKKYVKAALSLGSNSRLILRGANRFYLHIGEIDLAHKILLNSPLLSHDPWVQSAGDFDCEYTGKELLLSSLSPTAHREAETAKAHRG